MKILFILAGVFVALANVDGSISSTKITFDDLYSQAKDLVPLYPLFSKDIQFLMKQIKTARDIEENEISTEHTRFKRQTPSAVVTCSSLNAQIAQNQNDINVTLQKIANATKSINTFTALANNYTLKAALTTDPKQKDFNTRFATLCRSSATAANNTLQKLNQQLAQQQQLDSTLKNDLSFFCPESAVIPSPSSARCGTFVPYDSFGTSIYGFVGGTNSDGSNAYVGYGNGAACQNQFHAPCALSTGSTPGCKIPCGSQTIYDSRTSYYLYKNDALTWEPATSDSISRISNALTFLEPLSPMFGRTTIDGRKVLGKIISDASGVFTFQTNNAGAVVQLSENFEVLTCKKACDCPTTTAAPTTEAPSTTTSTTASTTSTTTTTTTTTTAVPYSPCGTFTDWDMTSTTITPALLGLESGTYYDVAKMYPGIAEFGAACYGQVPAPVRLTTVNTTKPAGGYMSCSNEMYGTYKLKFVNFHPNLAWVPANSYTFKDITGVIRIPYASNTANFYIGRTNLMKFANGTYKNIGKIPDNGYLYYAHDGTTEVAIQSGYEILTCLPYPAADLCKPNLIYYDPTTDPNLPATRGFPSGTFIDGSTIYPGIMNAASCWGQTSSPSRIVTTTTSTKPQGPGGYMSCSQPESFDKNSTSLAFFENSPRLKWIAANSTTCYKIPGAIDVPFIDKSQTMFVGRINLKLANGTSYHQIGKIHNGHIYYTNMDTNSEVAVPTGYEILACQ